MAQHLLTEESSTPSTPASGRWKLYFKAAGLFAMDDTGVEIGPLDGGAGQSRYYTFTASIGANALTVALKRLDSSDASAGAPIVLQVGTQLLTISAALSVTVTAAMADIFAWDTGKVQGNDAQVFIYIINNNGTAQIGVSPSPMLTTVATNFRDDVAQTGSAVQSNIVMSGTRHATNTCAVIGRVNVSQADNNNWQAPVTSKIVNYPIYETDPLNWTPTYTGFSTPPGNLLYKISREGVRMNLNGMAIAGTTSNLASFTFTSPFLCHATIGSQAHLSCVDNGAFQAVPGIANLPAASQTVAVYKTTINSNVFTTAAVKAVRGYMEFMAF